MVPVQGVSQEAFRFQLGQAAAGDVVPVLGGGFSYGDYVTSGRLAQLETEPP